MPVLSNLTDSLCLGVAKVPRSRDMAICANDDNDNDDTIDYFIPCIHT